MLSVARSSRAIRNLSVSLLLAPLLAGFAGCWQPKSVEQAWQSKPEPSIVLRPGCPASNVLFSPDGGVLAAGCERGRITLWESGAWKVLRTFEHPPSAAGHSSLFQLRFSPDGRWLASQAGVGGLNGSLDVTAKLWDPASGRELRTCRCSADLRVMFSPDSRLFLWQDPERNLRLLNLATSKELPTLPLGEALFSPDSRLLALSSRAGEVRVFEVATGSEVRALPGKNVARAFSPDGLLLAVVTTERLRAYAQKGTIKLWGMNSGEEVRTLGSTRTIADVAFSPDGRWLGVRTVDDIELWEVKTAKQRSLDGYSEWDQLTFSPNSRFLAAGTGQELRLWDLGSGRKLLETDGYYHVSGNVVFSPDVRWLALTTREDAVRLWDLSKLIHP